MLSKHLSTLCRTRSCLNNVISVGRYDHFQFEFLLSSLKSFLCSGHYISDGMASKSKIEASNQTVSSYCQVLQAPAAGCRPSCKGGGAREIIGSCQGCLSAVYINNHLLRVSNTSTLSYRTVALHHAYHIKTIINTDRTTQLLGNHDNVSNTTC